MSALRQPRDIFISIWRWLARPSLSSASRRPTGYRWLRDRSRRPRWFIFTACCFSPGRCTSRSRPPGAARTTRPASRRGHHCPGLRRLSVARGGNGVRLAHARSGASRVHLWRRGACGREAPELADQRHARLACLRRWNIGARSIAGRPQQQGGRELPRHWAFGAKLTATSTGRQDP